ncbi:MAG TPA: hypothetical protein O0W90_00675, partial [Methanocorpusculum sp.]|nr:hypothetical protein [Methanocorpusculum sp.]
MKLCNVSNGRPPSSRTLHKAVRAVLLSLLIIFVCATAFCGCVSADELTASNWDELVVNATADHADEVINITDQIVINQSTSDYNLDINGTIINCTCVMSNGKDAFNITDGAKLTVS